MKGTNEEYARGLVRKAENDWRSASVGLEHDAPLDSVCFHLQQAAEKLLKALLVVRNLDYPLTHDLKRLLDLATPEFPALEEFRATLPDYTKFAVEMRYDASLYPSREQTQAAFETVGRLRSLVHSLLPPQARP